MLTRANRSNGSVPWCSKLITAEETEMPPSRSTAVQSERTRRRSPRAFTSPASWIAPPNSSSFSVKVVLLASGCEMIAKVRRQAIWAVAGKWSGAGRVCDERRPLCQLKGSDYEMLARSGSGARPAVVGTR